MRPAAVAVALAIFVAAYGAIPEDDAPLGENLAILAELPGWLSGLTHKIIQEEVKTTSACHGRLLAESLAAGLNKGKGHWLGEALSEAVGHVPSEASLKQIREVVRRAVRVACGRSTKPQVTTTTCCVNGRLRRCDADSLAFALCVAGDRIQSQASC